MSYGEIINRTWNDNILFSVLLELTYSCNLNCYFCYNDLGLKGKPLSEKQYFELLDELAKLQVLHLVLSGGEPLAHPAFFRIGARARELGFLIRVKSNGHALNKRLARRIKNEVNPFAIDISLHGASPETHDRQTQVPGSYERLLANLKIMKDLGLRMKLNAVLTAWNEHELEQMFEVADQFDIPLLMDSSVTPRDNGDSEPTHIKASTEANQKMLSLLAQREPERFQRNPNNPEAAAPKTCDGNPTESEGKHCGAGAATLAVDPYGSVYPCVQWRRQLGNLHEMSLSEIWHQSPGLQPVRDMGESIKIKLRGMGEMGQFLGFCPGQAESETGSPLKLYPTSLDKGQAIIRMLNKGKPDNDEIDLTIKSGI